MKKDPDFKLDPIINDEVIGPVIEQMLQSGDTPLPSDLNSLVLKQIQNERAVTKTSTHLKKGLSMFTILKLAASILAMVTVGLIVSLSGQNDAYASIARQLEEMRAMMFRVQYVEESELDSVDAGKGQRVTYVAPSLYRIEQSADEVQIIDTGNNRMLRLLHSRKEALVMTGESVKTMASMSNVQLIESLQTHFNNNRDDDTIKKLGSRKINGRDATGLGSKLQGQQVEVWIDSDKNELVEARVQLNLPAQLTGGQEISMWHVMTDIRFDTEVEESVFDASVPKDYTLIEMPNIQIVPRVPDLGDLVDVLARCANVNHGVFPKSLSMNDDAGTPLGIMKQAAGELEKKQASMSKAEQEMAVQEVMGFGASVGSLTAFLANLKADQDFKYFPGAMLNEKNRPVAWYSPEADVNYLVVYANLSVVKTTKDKLPADPTVKSNSL